MKVPIPGFKGVYYDTSAENTAATVALTAAGRRAPKPHGYAVQLLPYLWSFDVDLQEVPNNHPIQYLHPEGAQSLAELADDHAGRAAGTDFETVLRFVWEVNAETEAAAKRVFGRDDPSKDGTIIEIEDGTVDVDGNELETDEFDIDEEANEFDTDEESGKR
ncbi:hypothetical protein [Halostagnicola sp. A-GB9-2]|uniref:hypothetical protein n=1 Tax=Halostagnicola sp. A-GB9-2 TaxID=3048066 RepID=UPI0024C06001|nr:hypothetical protein [Halostagnicola sp. A-GB9-2]MDJ1432143.1 hypothetical protein [Halostagnicola sp. A-GB9-2]